MDGYRDHGIEQIDPVGTYTDPGNWETNLADMY